MSENVNNQYDFFKLINLSEDGAIGVNVISGGTGGGGGATNTVVGTNGITNVGTNVNADLSLDTTTVTPGSYTSTNLTVNDRGQITAATDGPVPAITITQNNTQIIEIGQESDFPAPIGGIIDLVSGTTYIIRGDVQMTSQLRILSENVSLTGFDRDKDGLSYVGANGVGDFIYTRDVNFTMENLRISSTNTTSGDVAFRGDNFNYGDYNDNRLKLLSIINCQFRNCKDLMAIEGFDLCDINNTLFWYCEASTIGCQFKNVSKLQISSCEFVRWFTESSIPTPSGFATANMIDLLPNSPGNGFGAVNINGCVIHPQETQDGIKIDDATTIGFGTIASNTGIDIGLTTGLVSNFDYDTQLSIIVQANQKISNGNAKATLSLSDNTVLLDNSATNPIRLRDSSTVGGGGFTNPITFPVERRVTTNSANGIIRYDSKIPSNFFVVVSATVEQSGDAFITIRLRKNGVANTIVVGKTEIRQGRAEQLSFSVLGDAQQSDLFDLEVESSNGNDVLVRDLTLNGYQF